MQLRLFRHLWGVDTSAGYDTLFRRYRAFGYGGIEAAGRSIENKAAFTQVLREYELAFIPDIFSHEFRGESRVGGGTVAEHLARLRAEVERVAGFNPSLLNAQSGSDAWELTEAVDYYGRAVELAAEFGVRIAHETHRFTYLFNPWATRNLLRQVPALDLCADFSHWVCVCERLLDDVADCIELAADHCLHLHARVGYPQGPQVPDPRAPEYADALAAHESWWRLVWHSQQRRGVGTSTLTPEFGPAPYLHTLPYTNAPVADLAAICDWQAARQRAAFAEHTPA